MTADKTAVPEWIDVAFADGFGWSTYAAHEGDKTRFIRSDLCASGQVQAVMDAADRDADRCAERITELEAALEKARAEAKRMDLARDQFLGERNMLAEALREIQRGDMTGMMELTEAEAARTRATWAIKRIGTPVAALTPAPQPEGQVMDGWVDDKTFIEPVSPAATPTAQEAVPTEDELDEAWKSGFNAGFGEAKLTTNPPQPSETVAEITDLNHPAIDAFWDAHRNTVTTRDMNGWRRAVRNGLNAALRALKGGA